MLNPGRRRSLALALVANGLLASLRSARSPLPGRPLGLRWPFGSRSEAILFGSAIAPPLALQALVLAAATRGEGRRRAWPLDALAAAIFVGQLTEPIVYRLRSEAPATRLIVVGNLGLTGLLLADRARRTPVR